MLLILHARNFVRLYEIKVPLCTNLQFLFQSLTGCTAAGRAETWHIQCRISVTRYALDIDQMEDVDWSFPSYRQAQGNGMSCAARWTTARKQTRYIGPEEGRDLM
jgi:hypothetical protein